MRNSASSLRTAVVGHVEWVRFLRVADVPLPGDIVHASSGWTEPGGGGPGAAMQLLKLSGDTTFFTALGDDEVGRRAQAELKSMNLDLRVAWRDEPTRRAFTHVDDRGERTITVLGERLGPRGGDDLGWDDLAEMDCVFFTAGDTAAVRAARKGKVLVATSRVIDLIADAGVALDALVGSSKDPAEIYAPGDLDPAPILVVRTAGSEGGTWSLGDGGEIHSYMAPPLPGPVVDRYGAGDSFAGGLTYALGARYPAEHAVTFAARCGAAALTGRGPFQGQLKMSALDKQPIPKVDEPMKSGEGCLDH